MGSCVSRDPFEHDSKGDFEIVAYYARSSFASLGSESYIDERILEKIDSPFQRRSVRADMEKSIFTQLLKRDFDILLIDLIDERFDVSVNGSSIHTFSAEYKKALYRPNNYKILRADSSERLIYWQLGLNKIVDFLKENNLDHKVVINKVYWTFNSADEQCLIDRYGYEYKALMNSRLDYMYRELEKNLPKSRFITYSDAELCADVNHKWGLEPFHYVKSMQLRQLVSLKKILLDFGNHEAGLDYIKDLNERRMYFKYTPSADESNNPLLVILHGHGYVANPSKYTNENLNILAPIDNFGVNQWGSWWLGEGGDFFVKELLHELINQKRSKSSGRLYFWGSSMGGFGALLHGILLQADAVYANIPQIKLLGSSYSNRGMDKYFRPIFDSSGESGFNDIVNVLNDVVKAEVLGKVPLFFIAQSQFDYENYLEEQSLYFFKKCLELNLSVHYEVFPKKGHNLMMPLNKAIEKMLSYSFELRSTDIKENFKIDSDLKKNATHGDELKIVILPDNKIRIEFNNLRDDLKAFRLLLNGTKCFETKYLKNTNVVVPIEAAGVYRAVCLFKNGERILSKNIEVKKINPRSISLPSSSDEIFSLKDKINSVESSLQFIYSIEKDKYEELLRDKLKFFNLSKSVGQLVDICRFEKKMHAHYTDFARYSAELAFKTKPCDKTLYFYLESHLLNASHKKIQDFIEDLRKNSKLDKDCQLMLDLHEASLCGLKGEWELCDEKFSKYKINGGANIYWQSNLLVTKFEFGQDENLLAGNEIVINKMPVGNKYVVSISADMGYFLKYGRTFLESFRITCSHEAAVHIFLVNCDDNRIKDILEDWGVKDFVTVSYYKTPGWLDFRPVSASLRLIAISKILKQNNVPVFFSEIDCVIKKSLSSFVEELSERNCDQLVREIGAILPWQRYTCGFGVYMPSENGFFAAEILKNYLLGLFNTQKKLMWADQCALEASIRYSKINKSDYALYNPPISSLNDFVFTPTGSSEKKDAVIMEQFERLLDQYRVR